MKSLKNIGIFGRRYLYHLNLKHLNLSRKIEIKMNRELLNYCKLPFFAMNSNTSHFFQNDFSFRDINVFRNESGCTTYYDKSRECYFQFKISAFKISKNPY